jgi:hypothetical protein
MASAHLVLHPAINPVNPVAPSEIERDLMRLEGEMKQLEAEYNMFFAGRLPKPPWETRARVEALVKRYDRAYLQNTGDRFRFAMLQSRFAAYIDLWDRGMHAREEGRPGPFTHNAPQKEQPKKGPENRILRVAAFTDPLREIEKLTELYESLAEARREVGEDNVPFHRFAELVKVQVNKLRRGGNGEVAFRVAVKDGKVSFTARAMKGASD